MIIFKGTFTKQCMTLSLPLPGVQYPARYQLIDSEVSAKIQLYGLVY